MGIGDGVEVAGIGGVQLRVWSLGGKVKGFGLYGLGLEFEVWGLWCRVLGLRV